LERKERLVLLQKVHIVVYQQDQHMNLHTSLVTVKLAPVLLTTVAVVQFPDVRRATEAVTDILNKGIGIRTLSNTVNAKLTFITEKSAECIELCDDKFMRATNINGMSIRKWAEKDSLFIKFQGPDEKSLKEHIMKAKTIAQTHGALGFDVARSDEEANDLWNDRKNGHYAGLALIPGCRALATDVWCVIFCHSFFSCLLEWFLVFLCRVCQS
jgi:D-lactate dehydrogenase (cytochrome)